MAVAVLGLPLPLSSFVERVRQPLLFLGEFHEQGFVLVNIVGRLAVVFVEKVEDVARQDDGEQKQGGSPFASGEMEFRFHMAKIQSRRRGCQEGTRIICQQENVEKKNKNKIMFIKKCKYLFFNHILYIKCLK